MEMNNQDTSSAATILDSKKAHFNYLGSRLNLMFYCSIISLVVGVIGQIFSRTGNSSAGTIAGIIQIVLALAYGILICTLNSIDDSFVVPGVCYIFAEILSFLGDYTSSAGAIILGLVSLVCSLVYIFRFVNNLADWLDIAGSYRGDSWRLYLKFFVAIYVALFAAIVFLVLSLLGLAGLVLILASIGIIVLGIIQFVLLKSSANDCLAYTPRVPQNSHSLSSAMNASAKNAAPRGWMCTCGTFNAGFAPKCKCGKRKSEVVTEKPQNTGKLENDQAVNQTPTRRDAIKKEQETVRLLKEYKDLLDSGVLSQEEFDQKKAELLK